jgi:hypothetical protein
LKDDIIAVAILVHECRADGEPKSRLVLRASRPCMRDSWVADWPSLASFLWLGSVLVGAHDGEYARRFLRIGGIFRTAVHIEGVVVDFEEVTTFRTSPPGVPR